MIKKSSPKLSTSSSLTSIIVAGGAGFIGSHLCELLLEQNCQIYCLDNLTSGSKENIKHLTNSRNFNFIQCDLTQSLDQLELPVIDYVFHLAGYENYINDSNNNLHNTETLLVNSTGTKNLLEFALKNQSKFMLASTPYIYEGLISSKELSKYFGKKLNNENKYSLAEAKRFSETLVFEFFKNRNLDARIVRLIDVFGPKMPLNTDNFINSVFLSYLEKKTYKVPGKGDDDIYPTFVKDLVLGLLKATFSQNTSGKIYTLADSRSITKLNFVHLLNEILITNEIEFIAKENNDVKSIVDIKQIKENQEELNWYPKTSLTEEIKVTIDWLNKQTKPEPDNKTDMDNQITPLLLKEDKDLYKQSQENKVQTELVDKDKKTYTNTDKETKNIVKKKHPKRKNELKDLAMTKKGKILKVFWKLLIIFFVIITIFTTPFVAFFYKLGRGLRFINKQNYQKSLEYFVSSKETLLDYNWLTSVSIFKPKRDIMLTYLDMAINYLKAISKTDVLKNHFINLVGYIVKNERGDLFSEFNKIQIFANLIYNDLSFAESEFVNLKDTKNFFIPAKLQESIQLFKANSTDQRKNIDTFRQFLTVFPDIIAVDDKKTYLFLIEDNTELRPTGGFLVSFGLLTFEKGRLLDFEFKDISFADSQLKGSVDPPEPIKKYLNETNWFLRDANWSPDFPTSAAKASWFLEKEISKSVDGVFAVNLFFLRDLLKIVGPVEINEYNETVSADNLLELALYYSELDFSNSVNEGGFLTKLSNLVFLKTKKIDNNQWINLMPLFVNSFNKKDILIHIFDLNKTNIINERNWNGAIRKQLLGNEFGTVSDFIMLVEANLGVNKTNYYLKRDLKADITFLDSGEFIHSVTIQYNNENSSQGWPGGDYKSYLRLYVPIGTRIINIEYDDGNNSLKTINNNQIDEFIDAGKQVFGFLVQVPAKETLNLKITYQIPIILKFKDNLANYMLYWQKQPGTEKDSLNVNFIFPSSYKPLKIAPRAEYEDSTIFYKTNLSEDRILMTSFTK